MNQMRLVHGSLFSGFDAPSVAASWMGWENAFHCEINHFCNEILKYWFPNSEHYEDITKTDFSQWKGRIDVLTGGFPCQPFSIAGKRKGADDNRYLWPHMLRAIREIRPTWVIGENVAGILTMVQPGEEIEVGNQPSFFGEDDRKRVLLRQEYVIETICKDLEREGYSVQPMLIPACAVGAPHRRDRVWIIANRTDTGTESMQQTGEDGVNDAVTASDTERIGRSKMDYQVQPEQPNGNRADCNGFERFVADTDSNRRWWWKDKQEQFSECEGTSDNCVGCEDGLITYSDGLRNTPCKESERTERSRRRHFPQQSQRRDTPERTNGLHGLHGYATDTESQQSEQCELEQSYVGSKKQGELRGINSQSHTAETTIQDWKNFPTQSPVCRGNDGLPFNVYDITISFTKWRQESIKGYGNAIVPQVILEIFKAIEEVEKLA